MAKKKKASAKKVVKILALVAGVCAVLTFAAFLLPVISFEFYESVTQTTTSYTLSGYDMIFGNEEIATSTYNALLKLSGEGATSVKLITVMLIVFIVAVLNVGAQVLAFLGKKKVKVFAVLGSMVLSVAVVVLTIMAKGNFYTIMEIGENSQEYYKLAIGGFVVIALNSIGAVASLGVLTCK